MYPYKEDHGWFKFDQPLFLRRKGSNPGRCGRYAWWANRYEVMRGTRREKWKSIITPLPVLTRSGDLLWSRAPYWFIPRQEPTLFIHHPLRKGMWKKGFAESEEILEQTYTTQMIGTCFIIEPEAGYCSSARYTRRENNRKAIQNPFTTRRLVRRRYWIFLSIKVHRWSSHIWADRSAARTIQCVSFRARRACSG